jgi:hypothetical protein
MTDIRKDFVRDMNPPPCWEELASWIGAFNDYSTGYQAGRAHDVDGLIAEIEAAKFPDASDDWKTHHNNTHDNIATLVRKHFGKE